MCNKLNRKGATDSTQIQLDSDFVKLNFVSILPLACFHQKVPSTSLFKEVQGPATFPGVNSREFLSAFPQQDQSHSKCIKLAC